MATAKKEYSRSKPLLDIQYIRGFPFPLSKVFLKENIESALDYVPEDDDIIISTYPKAGTTWIKYIIWEIINKGTPLPSPSEIHFCHVPYLEMTGSTIVKSLPSPRIIQFHLPYHLTPRNPLAKYIYVIRNPKDTLVSYYHFTKDVEGRDIPFNDYFDSFLEGKTFFGDCFDHLLSWYEHRDDPNILILCYEQMKANPRDELLKIAEFLGHNYLDMLKEDEEMVITILERTSFSFLKRNLNRTEDTDDEKISANAKGRKGNPLDFFRKGITGDWKNHFTPEQDDRFDKKMAEKLKESDVGKLWIV